MTAKIHVLHLLEATVGGTRKHLVSLVDGLDKSRFAVEVAATPSREGSVGDTGFTAELAATAVPFYPVQMARSINPWLDLRALWQLHQLLRQKKYHIIHSHSSKAGFLGRLLARWHGIPAVYTPNGYYFLDSGDGRRLKRFFFLQLERLAGRWTDQLIAVSASERAVTLAQRLVPASQLVTIPNGIDSTAVQPDPAARLAVRQALGIDPDTAVVGTVARFIPQKDPFTFVRTAQQLLQQMPQLRFIWCGEGPQQAQTEQLAADLGVAHAFHFLGFRPDVGQIMNAFDLFMLTSVFEGLPYTLLEVMALGLPVVATQVVGSQDVVLDGQTGYLRPVGDATALAQAAGQLLSSPEQRQRFGQNGRALVQQQYDVRQMVQAVENLYQSLYNANQSKPV